jgi:pimeloyl-ACP methyl ester carboxylesterase
MNEVRTWYEERGSGDPLVLLHGGLVDARFFEHNIGALAAHFHVFATDLRAHGHTPDVEGPLTFDVMAQDTIQFIEEVVGGPAHLVGHSNGAFVALLVALRRADLVRRLVVVSFDRDGFVHQGEQFDVDDVVAALGPSYGEVSPHGQQHFRAVVEKVAEMERNEPALPGSELRNVRPRTLGMFGDDDLMTIEHVKATYDGIPDSELAIVPGTSHFLLQEKPELCNHILIQFLTQDPVATVAPIRRAR